MLIIFFFFSSRRRHTRYWRDWSSDVCSSDLYDCAEGEQVEVQMGVSFVSIANARENLEAEQRGKTFDAVRADARQTWEEALSRITVEGGTEAQKRVFYTALYHSQLHPNILQDVNGQFPEMENNRVGYTKGNRYTVFSLWDRSEEHTSELQSR